MRSLAAHDPKTGTPTGPALQGALAFASSWARANPGRIVVTVLATDGVPKGCAGDDIEHVAAVAKSGYLARPSIRTYAIGLGTSFDDMLLDGGSWLDNLNIVAEAGGTASAFPITKKVALLFLEALNTIRGKALGCAFLLPESMGKPLDYQQVNFLYTRGGTTATVYVRKVANAAACSGDGVVLRRRPKADAPRRLRRDVQEAQHGFLGQGGDRGRLPHDRSLITSIHHDLPTRA